MGTQCCLVFLNMQFFVLLAIVSAAIAAPAPQEGDVAPVALPYVHEEIAAEPYVHEEPVETAEIAAEPYIHEDIAAEPYVHEEIAAEAYVHEEPVETAEIAAEPYVHEEIAAEPYNAAVQYVAAPAQPAAPVQVTYAAAPAAKAVAAAPVAYAYAAPFYAAYHSGCVNSVGSVVPCA